MTREPPGASSQPFGESRPRGGAAPGFEAAPTSRAGGVDRGDGRDAAGRITDPTKIGTATRWQPANRGHWLHGGRSKVQRDRRLAEVRARLEQDEAAIIGALGGSPDALQMILVKRLAVATTIVEDLEDNLLSDGCVTGTQRTRLAVAPYERQVDRVARLVGHLRAGKGTAPAPDVAELLANLREGRGDSRC